MKICLQDVTRRRNICIDCSFPRRWFLWLETKENYKHGGKHMQIRKGKLVMISTSNIGSATLSKRIDLPLALESILIDIAENQNL